MARRLYSLTACLIIVTTALGACNKRSEPPEPRQEQPTLPTPPPTPSQPPPPSTPPVSGEDPARAQALLDRWLQAQNQQDFATYESLYASRFEGIRRSGPRVVRLDRAGWIADRQRMFRKPMTVELSDILITPFATGAVVQLTQRWSSGTYEDIGPKQLVVVREGGTLHIAREEMLASELVNNRAKATNLATPELAFVIRVADEQYVVLDQKDITPSSLELISKDEPVTVTGELDAAAVAPEVASWLGQRVSSSSGACTGTITKLVAISRSYPHFSVHQTWAGTFEPDENRAPYTDAQIAQSAFALTPPLITGLLDTGGCTMSWIARKGELPPAMDSRAVTTAAIEKAAVRAFRALPAYKGIQQDFTEMVPGASGPWEENADDAKPPVVQAYQHPASKQTIVAVHAAAGVGCGQFAGSLSVLFRMTGSPDKPTLEPIGTAGFDEVHAVLDIDNDGSLELIVHQPIEVTSVIRSDGTHLRSIEIPFLDCGC